MQSDHRLGLTNHNHESSTSPLPLQQQASGVNTGVWEVRKEWFCVQGYFNPFKFRPHRFASNIWHFPGYFPTISEISSKISPFFFFFFLVGGGGGGRIIIQIQRLTETYLFIKLNYLFCIG